MKNYMDILFASIFTGSILFSVMTISIEMYMLMIFGVFIWLTARYNWNKSRQLFFQIICLMLGLTIGYACNIDTLYSLAYLDPMFLDKVYMRLKLNSIVWVLILQGIIIACIYMKFTNIKERNVDMGELYPKRKADLNRLRQYIDAFPIVGLNGPWGTGKTRIIEELKKEEKSKYEILEINVLACNLDCLVSIIISELDNLMSRNRIGSTYSRKLRYVFSWNNNISSMTNKILFENTSISSSINHFAIDMKKLDKTVLIIFEDIDRIAKRDDIIKILGISEKLSQFGIKIVYQYDKEYFLEKLKFSTAFLEKYIPYNIDVSEYNFLDMINLVLETKKVPESKLKYNDFTFLISEYHVSNIAFDIKEYKIISANNMNFTARKIEFFIEEILHLLECCNYNKRVLITMVFLKLFWNECYTKFLAMKEVEKTFTFSYHGTEIDIQDMLSIKKHLDKDFWNDNNNIVSFSVLAWLNLEVIKSTTYAIRRTQEKNEKINHTVWNLLEAGQSSKTDKEYAVKLFIQTVLALSSDKWEEGYNEWIEKNIEGNGLGNTTILMMGNGGILDIFRAFKTRSDLGDKIVIGQIPNLIRFYEKIEKPSDINTKTLKIFNSIFIGTRESYFEALKLFISLKVTYDMAQSPEFKEFCKEYITTKNWGFDAWGETSQLSGSINEFLSLDKEDRKKHYNGIVEHMARNRLTMSTSAA